ncbi:MAG TPA: PspC domain-containing protein, partial [Propionibacteriaceae bacterium]
MSSVWTIRRSATDAKLSGLCGGVAQHWGIDPVLVRVGWVLLAFSSGIGLVLYLAGWLLIPVEGSDKALVDDL